LAWAIRGGREKRKKKEREKKKERKKKKKKGNVDSLQVPTRFELLHWRIHARGGRGWGKGEKGEKKRKKKKASAGHSRCNRSLLGLIEEDNGGGKGKEREEGKERKKGEEKRGTAIVYARSITSPNLLPSKIWRIQPVTDAGKRGRKGGEKKKKRERKSRLL